MLIHVKKPIAVTIISKMEQPKSVLQHVVIWNMMILNVLKTVHKTRIYTTFKMVNIFVSKTVQLELNLKHLHQLMVQMLCVLLNVT